MRQALFCLTFFLSAFFSNAQNLNSSISWGNVFKSNTFLHQIIGSDDQYVYILQEKYTSLFKELSGDLILQKVDLDGNFVENIDIVIPDNGNFIDVYMANGEIYFYSARKRNNTVFIDVNRFDKAGKKIEDNDELLVSYDYFKIGIWSYSNLQTFASPNKEHFLFYYRLPVEDKESKERFALAKFDKDFKLEWKREVELPCERSKFWTHNFVVDDNGGVHVIAVIFNNEKMKHPGDQKYDYYLINIDETDIDIYQQNVRVGNISVLRGHASVINGNELTTVCQYTNISKETNIDGIFAIRVNTETGEFIKKTQIPYTRYFVESLSTKPKEISTFKLDNLYLDNIILHPDGSISVVSEVSDAYARTLETYDQRRNQYSQSTRNLYLNNSIVIVRINEKLNHKWTKAIHKRQRSQLTNDYHGYLVYSDGNDLRILFNDDVKNNHEEIFDITDLKEYNSLKRNRKVVEAIVDHNGVINYNVLHKGGPYKLVMTEKKRSPIMENGDYIMASKLNQGYKRKKRQIGIYKF